MDILKEDFFTRRSLDRSPRIVWPQAKRVLLMCIIPMIPLLLMSDNTPPAKAGAPDLTPKTINALPVSWAGESAGGPVLPSPAQYKVTKGVFLVADPKLIDPNFGESVLLILAHGGGGSLGLIINRSTARSLAGLLPSIKALENRPDTLYVGGPVYHDSLVMLLRTQEKTPSMDRVFDDIYMSRGLGELTDILKNTGPQSAFRIYAGHAGWAPGQLQGEMNRGDWRVIPADADIIFAKDPETVWPEMIRRSSQQWVYNGPRLGFLGDGFGPVD